ncbi:MAG: hypothetical protein ACLSA2_01415 [Candidatus Gastranaerophilaceae bacterium]
MLSRNMQRHIFSTLAGAMGNPACSFAVRYNWRWHMDLTAATGTTALIIQIRQKRNLE